MSLALVFVGCDDTPDSPIPPDPDQARECHPPGVDAGGALDGGPPGCGPGELCLEGRCYTACTEDADCGPGESCAASGACVRSTDDAGVEEPDVCATVRCSPSEVCHPILGQCVACSVDTVAAPEGAPGHCADDTVCDIVLGQCVSAEPSQCAPCSSDGDCTTDEVAGKCVGRTVMGIQERVCMLACAEDGSCPSGLRCGDDNLCVPVAEMACEVWLRGTSRAPCLSDTECAPVGTPPAAIFPNICEGVQSGTADDGGISEITGQCSLPCEVDEDCPSGQSCVDDGGTSFCRPEESPS